MTDLFSVFSLFFKPHLQADLWHLATRTCGAWWCRYRGHWRSCTRHLSTRSRVYAQKWHRKDVHSHIHSHPPMRTPKLSKLRAKSTTYWTWFFPLLVLFLSNVVGVDGQEAWQMLLRTAPRRRPSRPGQYRQKTFVDVLNTYSNISRQRWPF